MNPETLQQYLDTMDRIAYHLRAIGAQLGVLSIVTRELQGACQSLGALMPASVVELKGMQSD